jgi:hypothetical protein
LAGFDVKGGYPIIANVWIREVDDLPGIGRVGYHFLVATKHCVEDHFSRSDFDLSAD